MTKHVIDEKPMTDKLAKSFEGCIVTVNVNGFVIIGKFVYFTKNDFNPVFQFNILKGNEEVFLNYISILRAVYSESYETIFID